MLIWTALFLFLDFRFL